MNFFTSGKAAKILGVSARTVNNWFDKGLLKGHRIGVGKHGDRRISDSVLAKFILDNNFTPDHPDIRHAVNVEINRRLQEEARKASGLYDNEFKPMKLRINGLNRDKIDELGLSVCKELGSHHFVVLVDTRLKLDEIEKLHR